MGKRVVVTGLGAVSGMGNCLGEIWNAAKNGDSGIDKITRFDCSGFPAKCASEVKDFNLSDYMYVNERHRMDRFSQYAIASSVMAVEDSRLTIGVDVPPDRVGVWMGTAIGGIESFEDTHRQLLEGGYERVYPFATTLVISNMASSQVAIALNAKGVNNCTVLSCASGSNAIGDAMRVIQSGEADIMIAGGTEASITPLGIGAFCAMGAISPQGDPKAACRPFDRNRDGLVMGEGAGALVLETFESAIRRNAPVYGEIIGYGTVGDAYHITSPVPGGEGCVRAMEMAFAQSGVLKSDIDYINAHGTSTILNDRDETKAIQTFFGEKAYDIPVSSTKSMTGHMMGASGAVEAILTFMTMKTGVILPTLNLIERDPECDLDYVPNLPRFKEVNFALSNSLGFGGHNTVLIFKALS
ncbi:beta-ketoacyl-ACP synthase II [Bacillus sp. NTK074B]|uniref:beta-ketoacyl-ACP synthase II n=1 Tax=Bacillus sp. NTK074B TaxID=2802174 RepID=UPI001A8FE9AE|nr:beta-ketoacyl-ACP synthase II [Bacillus sp. NTK074B]